MGYGAAAMGQEQLSRSNGIREAGREGWDGRDRAGRKGGNDGMGLLRGGVESWVW
jgi:hypothetical protein